MSDYKDLKPKETLYKGVWYDSKLEAKWAVFFTSADIEYISKPGTFPKRHGGGYKPDFYLPEFDLYVEVKRNTNDGIQEVLDKCVEAIIWGGKIKQILILSDVPIGHSLDGGIWHFPIIYWKADDIEWGWWFFFDGWGDGDKCICGGISGSDYWAPPNHIKEKLSIAPISDYELRKCWPYNKELPKGKDLDESIYHQEYFNRYTFKAFNKAYKAWFTEGNMPDTKTVFEEE